MGDYKVVQIGEVKRLEKSVNYKLFVIKKEFGQLGQIFLQFSRGNKIKVVQVVQKGITVNLQHPSSFDFASGNKSELCSNLHDLIIL